MEDFVIRKDFTFEQVDNLLTGQSLDPRSIQARIRQVPPAKIYGQSTLSNEITGKDVLLITRGTERKSVGLAKAYGVNIDVPFLKNVFNPTQYIDIGARTDENELIRTYSIEVHYPNNPLTSEKEGERLKQEITLKDQTLDSDIIDWFLGFIQKYRSQFDAALEILTRNHPDIDPGFIKCAYAELILVEFEFYQFSDAMQDTAMAVYTDSPWRKPLEKHLFGFFSAPAGWLANSSPGEWLWRKYSLARDVPLENQGFGPLQIIPGLAISALAEPGLYESGYNKFLDTPEFNEAVKILRTEGPLTEEEYEKVLKIVSKATLDPEKMFALKAMTWDLQLTNVKTVPVAVASSTIPFIKNYDTARQIAIVMGAFFMVQYPERHEVLEEVPAVSYSRLSRHYLLGHALGISINLKGLSVLKTDSKNPCVEYAPGGFTVDYTEYCLISF